MVEPDQRALRFAMMPRMRIDYAIADDWWRDTLASRHSEPPGSDYDRSHEPLYEGLYGVVRISADGLVYEGHQGAFARKEELVPVLDLAVQFASFLEEPRPSPNFGDVEGLFSVGFWESGDGVDVVTPVGVIPGLSQSEVIGALRDFLHRLLDEIRQRGPEILDWDSLAPLRRFD